MLEDELLTTIQKINDFFPAPQYILVQATIILFGVLQVLALGLASTLANNTEASRK